MATTHVFIVDATTFKIHLEYLFAGTGARDYKIDFNNRKKSSLHHSQENNLVRMLGDSQRIRKNDFILFYLQQNISQGIEGQFFGIFKAVEDISFLDNNTSNQYLKNKLNKSLTFRTLIKPYKVYKKGLTEWEALDNITKLNNPYELQWSLIYRKLKGNRGNTMITSYEAKKLFTLIKKKNGYKDLKGQKYSFDSGKKEIILDKSKRKKYCGKKSKVNILPRLRYKYFLNQAFEDYLNTYIVQNIGRNLNKTLDKNIINSEEVIWIGNEISCGVGMQRIDVLLVTKKNNKRYVIPIELKSIVYYDNILTQMQRYIDWLEAYFLPNYHCIIRPIIITRNTPDCKNSLSQTKIKKFNKNNNCLPIIRIEYFFNNNNKLKFYKANNEK